MQQHSNRPMAEIPTTRPVLPKPPGYRDPTPASTAPRPLSRKPQIPPPLRRPVKPSRRRSSNRSFCRRICCWISIALLVLALILAVAGVLCYLWLQPRLPSFHLASLQFPQFRVAVRSDGTFLDAVTAVRIQAANPNGKIDLSYGESEARVTIVDDDGDIEVGSGSAAGFVQRRQNSTAMRFNASVRGVVLVDDAVGSRLQTRFRNKGIQFAVEARTRVGVAVAGKSTAEVPIRILCGAVRLKQVGNGGAPPRCHINILRWINLV